MDLGIQQHLAYQPHPHAMSASLIERLPQELLDMALGYLPRNSQSFLGRCSKILRYRVEPTLFGTEDNRGWAMKRACQRGLHNVILTALQFGSNPTIIPIYLAARQKTIHTSTLAIAAKHNKQATFRFLVDLGARIDHPKIHPTALKSIIRYLARPRSGETLNHFLSAGLMTQLSQVGRDRLLVDCLKSLGVEAVPTAAVERFRFMLKEGADPNSGQFPLSIVIPQRQWDPFQLPLDQGGDINRVSYDLDNLPDPDNLPIVVVVKDMATRKGSIDRRDGVAKCTEAGADINVAIPTGYDKDRFFTRVVTPLLIYIEAAARWGSDETTDLQYLLEYGASPDCVFDKLPEDPKVKRSHDIDSRCFEKFYNSGLTVISPTDPIDVIIGKFRDQKWSLEGGYLAETIKILAFKTKLRPRKLGRLMGPVTLGQAEDKILNSRFFHHWSAILEFVVSNAAQGDLDTFLGAYIVSRGTLPMRYAETPGDPFVRICPPGGGDCVVPTEGRGQHQCTHFPLWKRGLLHDSVPAV